MESTSDTERKMREIKKTNRTKDRIFKYLQENDRYRKQRRCYILFLESMKKKTKVIKNIYNLGKH